MFTVYALYNRMANKIYIGQSGDIERRLAEHNSRQNSHFTGKFEGEWQLIYKEQVATRSEALKREKQLKSSRGREFIKTYIPE